MHSTHFTIKGKVQGVGMRYMIREKAQELGLTGWVRNKPDGSVEIIAQGAQDRITLLQEYLETSPGDSQVNELFHTSIDAEQCADFIVGA